jgi:hypothetical protein
MIAYPTPDSSKHNKIIYFMKKFRFLIGSPGRDGNFISCRDCPDLIKALLNSGLAGEKHK